MKARADSRAELQIRQEQVHDHGHVDLAQDRVFRVADERFELEILLDQPKKYFDLPTLFVDVGNGFGRERKVVGQVFVVVTGLGVAIPDPAEPEFTPARLDQDFLIRGHALLSVDRATFEHAVGSVVLLAGDEKHAGFGKRLKPRVADIAPVKSDDGALGQTQSPGEP